MHVATHGEVIFDVEWDLVVGKIRTVSLHVLRVAGVHVAIIAPQRKPWRRIEDGFQLDAWNVGGAGVGSNVLQIGEFLHL